MKKVHTVLIGWYFLIIILLGIYSYTQVDLGLTLSKASKYLTIEKSLQFIGYFQRPLSTVFYSSLVVLLFIFYFLFLRLSSKGLLSRKTLCYTFLGTAVILTFSYNAFSYDIFNYIFDAKIITFYHPNPYLHMATDFPHDPMLSFMHWVGRTYPYGPTWLLLTVPSSFLGAKIFLVTFFLFKLLASASYIASCMLIEKILKKIHPKAEQFGVVFFALNPLVIIESLVSAHNDISMIALFLFSIYLLLNQKYFQSLFMFILSVGVKFFTIFSVPMLLLIFFKQKIHKIQKLDTVFLIGFMCMILPVILASMRTNFQPWYLLGIIALVPFVGKKYFVFVPAIIISFFSLLIYIPFLYTGNWDNPIPTILFWIMTCGILVSSGTSVVLFAINSIKQK